MKKALLLIASIFLLSGMSSIYAEEMILSNLGPEETKYETLRAKHLAIGRTYKDPAITPESFFTDSPDVDILVQGNVGINTIPCTGLSNDYGMRLNVLGEVLIGGGPFTEASYNGLPFSLGSGANALWINAYDKQAVGDYGVIYGKQIFDGTQNIYRLNILSGGNKSAVPNANVDDEVFIGNIGYIKKGGTRSGMIIKSGMVGILTETPDQKLTVYNGSSIGRYTTTGWTHTSDMRLKADIGRIDNALDKIMAIDGVYFNWKNDPEAGRQIGFIAQDLMKVLPETVMKNNDGYYTTAYDEVIPVLVNAIKELKEEQESLKIEVGALEAKIPQ